MGIDGVADRIFWLVGIVALLSPLCYYGVLRFIDAVKEVRKAWLVAADEVARTEFELNLTKEAQQWPERLVSKLKS
jgi:hypothetical protein